MLEKLKAKMGAATRAEAALATNSTNLSRRSAVVALLQCNKAARNAVPKLIEMVEMCERALDDILRAHHEDSIIASQAREAMRNLCRMAAEIEGE